MFIGISTAISAIRRVSESFIRDGLKLYYRFTETFNESQPELLLSGATSFDGTDDYIDFGSDSSLDNIWNGGGTISAWFFPKSDGEGDEGRIIEKRDDGSGWVLHMREESSGTSKLKFYINYSSQAGQFTTNNDVIINQWNHVAVIYDTSGAGSSYRPTIYINGSITSFSATIDTSGSVSSDASESLVIGNVKTNLNRSFDGSIANVGIWNRALSLSEIESIYWKGQYADLKGTELTNLVSWYNLKETGYGSELITNGDFSSFSSGQATNWTTTGSPTLSEETTIVQSGSSQKIFMGSSGNNGLNQDITSVAGATYEFTAKIYVTGGKARIIFDNGTDDGEIYVGVGGTSGYTDLNVWHTVSFTKTAQGTILTARLWTNSANTTLFADDVSIKEVIAPDSTGTNNGSIYGATTLTDAYSASSPFLPRIQDKATPKGAIALASGSTSFATDDYISLPSLASTIGNGALTFAGWFKTNTLADYYPLYIGTPSSNANYIVLKINSNGTILTQARLSGTVDLTSTATITAGNWHHIAVTRSGTTGTLYVDGTSVTSTDSNWGVTVGSETTLGAFRIASNSGFYTGSIANVAIYSDAKTQSQIQDIMFSSYSTLTSALKTNLVSWYDLGSTELGSELVTNGDFATDSNWTKGNGWTIAGGVASVDPTAGGSLDQTLTTIVGKRYFLSYTISNYVATSITVGLDGLIDDGSKSANGSYSFAFTATSTSHAIRIFSAPSSNMDIDDVSVRQISLGDLHGSNDGLPIGVTTNTGYTSSPSGVADPLNYGEVYGGNAVSFDGSNDYINIVNSVEWQKPKTVSMWFKATSISSHGSNVYNKDTLIGYANLFWAIQLDVNKKIQYFYYDGSLRSWLTDSTITLSKWHHIAVVSDGDSSQIFLDGQSIGSNSLTWDDVTIGVDKQLKLGGTGGGFATQPFTGSMSHVQIFSEALTQDQVRELYTKPELTLPTGISSSALKLDMPMQEGSGTAILDGSPTTSDDFITEFVNGSSYPLDSFATNGDDITLFTESASFGGAVSNTFEVVNGNKYLIEFNYTHISGDGVRVVLTNTNTGAGAQISNNITLNSTQTVQSIFTATASSSVGRLQIGTGSGSHSVNCTISNASVKLLGLGQNHGTGSGITWATGQEYGFQHPLVRSNNPMRFETSDYVTVSKNSGTQISTGTYSVSVWIKPEGGTDSGTNYEIIDAESYNNNGWLIRLTGTDLKPYVRHNQASSATALSSTTAVTNGVWSHLVFVFASGTGAWYINGSLINSGSITAPVLGTTDMQIGGRSAQYFDGFINELSIWDSALTANEVTALYNSGLPLLPTTDSGNYASADDLVGYWRNDGVTTWLDKANTGVASFDGTNDYLDTNSAFQSTFRSFFSMSLWVKPDDGQPSAESSFFGTRNSTSQDWIQSNLHTDGKVSFFYRSDNDTAEAKTSSAVFANGLTSWTHIAYVADDSDDQLKIYVNGSIVSVTNGGLGSVTMADWTSSDELFIGARDNNGTAEKFFNGQIASTNIFNTALSATEVSELYAIDKRSSISGFSQLSNCVGSWLMGAGTGDTTSTIQDQTSNNNDATVSGANLIGYNDGTVSGDPASIIVPEGLNEGRDSQGYYLTDTDSISSGIRLKGAEYISVQDSESLSFGNGTSDSPFSLEAWVKMNDASSFMILTKGAYNVNAEYNFYTNGSDKLHFIIYDESVSATYQGRLYDTALTSFEGQWIHCVATYDGRGGTSAKDGINLYLNGLAVDNANLSGGSYVSMENLGADLIIGKDGSTFAKGSIDEVKVYAKELSASEVLKNYNNGKSAHSN